MGIQNSRVFYILRFLRTLDSLDFEKIAGGLMRTSKFNEIIASFKVKDNL